MDLTLQLPGDHLYIREISEKGIRIRDQVYTKPLILSAEQLETNWPVSVAQALQVEDFNPIFAFEPEIVLIGTGNKQVLFGPELLIAFYSRNIGVEVMSTDAACRTFNVLVSEERCVTAALFPLDDGAQTS